MGTRYSVFKFSQELNPVQCTSVVDKLCENLSYFNVNYKHGYPSYYSFNVKFKSPNFNRSNIFSKKKIIIKTEAKVLESHDVSVQCTSAVDKIMKGRGMHI